MIRHDVKLSADISNFLIWLDKEIAAPYLMILIEENYIQHDDCLLSMDPAQFKFLMKEKAQGIFF